MATTFDIQLPHYSRGFHLITRDIISQLPALPESGLLVVFIKHTSAGLTINENADPDVRHDFQTFFNKLVPDGWEILKRNSLYLCIIYRRSVKFI